MYCEPLPSKPPKPPCRCKNCVLRPEDIVPWTDVMGVAMTDKERAPSRRPTTRDTWDSIYDGGTPRKSGIGGNTPQESTPARTVHNTPSLTSMYKDTPPHPPAANQPTILLIVVNKDQPSFPGSGPGYPGAGPGYPGSSSGYPGSGPGYPGSGPGYPGSGPGYPGSGPGYPGAGPGYPGSGPGYPGSGPGYPGSGPGYLGPAPGYPGSTPGGYPGQAPRGYPGQLPRGYPAPGPRRFSGVGGGPTGQVHSPSGPGPRRRPGYEDRFRNDGYRNFRNEPRYPDDWRRQSMGYPNNGYTDPARNRRSPGEQRSCQCHEKSNKSISPEEPVDMFQIDDNNIQGNRGVDNRLEGSGNGQACNCTNDEGDSSRTNERRPRNCRCKASESSDLSINEDSSQNIQDNQAGHKNQEGLQEVVVTDGTKKIFKCIQVPICISVGKPDCCKCCKCAPAPDPDLESMRKEEPEEEECICNPHGKCNCVVNPTYPDEFTCECTLTNLERALRNLIPNADCMCYLKKKKKRRRRRKKWAPKVYYDRFANPPFVLNPKPRCLEYGCSPCRCCCAPVAKTCYNCDYCCGC